MVTGATNYKDRYARIAHLATDKMASLHKYLKAETDGFQEWGDVMSDKDFQKQLLAHFKQVDELYKSVNTDEGYSGHKFEGSAYRRTQNLDIKEIAKLIREELAIEFPGCKFSVKIDRYSMGQSIDVSIQDVDFDPLHADLKKALASGKSYDDYVRDREYFNNGSSSKPVYNAAYDKFAAKVKSIVQQYNMDDSDSQSDYFHTRFHSSISRLDVPAYLARQADPNYEQKQKAASKANREQERKEADARKQKRSALYGDFKLGELVYWVSHYDAKNGHFKKGEPVLGKIIKAPNGRGSMGRHGFSNYKLGLYFPVGSAPVKHRQGAPALTHNGVGYYYYGNYDYGTKENLRSLVQIEQPKSKRKASLTTVRKRATTKTAASTIRKATATKKASTAKAKRKPNRETVTATLDSYRTAAKKSTAVKAKSRLRQETGTTGAKRRTAKPVATVPVSKPKKAATKATKPKTKRKPCKTSKQTLQRISRLEATNRKLRSELATDERLIKKVHRQTKR